MGQIYEKWKFPKIYEENFHNKIYVYVDYLSIIRCLVVTLDNPLKQCIECSMDLFCEAL